MDIIVLIVASDIFPDIPKNGYMISMWSSEIIGIKYNQKQISVLPYLHHQICADRGNSIPSHA
jgi:hypothetical protein